MKKKTNKKKSISENNPVWSRILVPHFTETVSEGQIQTAQVTQ